MSSRTRSSITVRWLTGLLLAVATLAAPSFAQDAAREQTPMMLVMTDGRILKGQLSRHAVGYYVERHGGSILIPHEQIRCVARDLKDAYRLEREQMIAPTSAMLIQLAEWCISYRLYDEAGDELRRALRRDPESDAARQLLARLDEMLKSDPAKSLSPKQGEAIGFLSADVEALGGLSRPVAAEFTTKIQPLLINKCGNASCHGTASNNSFRLVHVRNGSANHRRAAEQNFALALKHIDIAQPEESELLKRSQGAHGGAALAIFGGASGAVQTALLEKWVAAVANERQTEAQKLARRTQLKSKKTASPAMSNVTPSRPTPAAESEPPAVIQTASAEEPADPAPEESSAPPRPPRPAPVHDAFDPEVFNRRFGGQPSSGSR